jgi:hypothetical protein
MRHGYGASVTWKLTNFVSYGRNALKLEPAISSFHGKKKHREGNSRGRQEGGKKACCIGGV